MAFHGSSFCSTGNVYPKKLSGFPCLGVGSFRELIRVPPLLLKRSSYVVAQDFGRTRQRHCYLTMQTGRSKTFVRLSRLHSLRPPQAKGEDLEEGSLSGESIILDSETLKRDLHIAIAEENYAKAAKIRDSLKLLNEDRKSSVLATNARFYNAFRAGDLAAMQTLWAKGPEVCCVHPGARGISGYDDVITSWEYVWANYEFPLDIELKDVEVSVRGDMGYVTCVELVRTKGSSWGGQFVTNVFERIEDQWFISIHHASPIDL